MSEDDFLVHPEESERLQAGGLLSASKAGERKQSSSINSSNSDPEWEDSGVATIYNICHRSRGGI